MRKGSLYLEAITTLNVYILTNRVKIYDTKLTVLEKEISKTTMCL